MTPVQIRAYADSCVPRVLNDGWTINPQHVAIESTLRNRHGHPSWIAELDGPGRYRPVTLDHRAALEQLVADLVAADLAFLERVRWLVAAQRRRVRVVTDRKRRGHR